MSPHPKPYPTLQNLARALEQEASWGEARANNLSKEALRLERAGEGERAEALWSTCRKLRVQVLMDRTLGVAAEVRAALSRPDPRRTG